MFSDVLQSYHGFPGYGTCSQLTLIMAGGELLYAELLKWGFPTSLHDVFLESSKREKAFFIFLCAIGKIRDRC